MDDKKLKKYLEHELAVMKKRSPKMLEDPNSEYLAESIWSDLKGWFNLSHEDASRTVAVFKSNPKKWIDGA